MGVKLENKRKAAEEELKLTMPCDLQRENFSDNFDDDFEQEEQQPLVSPTQCFNKVEGPSPEKCDNPYSRRLSERCDGQLDSDVSLSCEQHRDFANQYAAIHNAFRKMQPLTSQRDDDDEVEPGLMRCQEGFVVADGSPGPFNHSYHEVGLVGL